MMHISDGKKSSRRFNLVLDVSGNNVRADKRVAKKKMVRINTLCRPDNGGFLFCFLHNHVKFQRRQTMRDFPFHTTFQRNWFFVLGASRIGFS